MRSITPPLRSRLVRGIAACLAGMAILTGCVTAEPLQNQAEQIGPDYFKTGSYSHVIRDTVWRDEDRNRDIAVKLYVPERSDPAPVIVFSHGLGGSTGAAPYFGRHLASWGFLSVHIQHPGSDAKVWRGLQGRRAIIAALKDAASDPQTSINRYNDLPFVLDQIVLRTDAGELNADTSKIGMAGHSFGAHSVLAAAGRTYTTPSGAIRFNEPRIKAAVALSPPAPGRQDSPDSYDTVYGGISIPILHMTGTEDTSPLVRDQDPTSRETPFQQIDGAPQYLVVFDGADHGVFGGQRMGRRSPAYYPDVQEKVAGASTAFFAAHLGIDGRAQIWLDGPGFLTAFSEYDRVERR